MAIEDIGLADPQALVQALAAKDVFDFLGSPEGELALAQAVGLSGHGAQIECGLCRLRRGHARRQGARQPGAAQAHPQRADRLMKEEGYGAGYAYDHDTAEAFSGQNYFPDEHDARAVLRSAGARLRGGDQEAAGVLGEAAQAG